MKDIRQIKILTDSLNKEKEKYLFELAKLNTSIVNKHSMINKMMSYQSEYLNTEKLKLSKSVPGLNKNIHLFIGKIDTVIKQAEMELSSLQRLKSSILETIGKIDQKINLMSVFETRSNKLLTEKEERQEQRTMDDAVSTVSGGTSHE